MTVQAEETYFPLELKKIHNKVNVPAMSLAQCEVARMHCY